MALIMFDYDGVIVDSKDLFVTHFTAACAEYGHTQLDSGQEVLALFEGNVYEVMQQKGVPKEDLDKILQLYEKKMLESNVEPKLFAGISEIFAHLANKHKLYIITSNVSGIPMKLLLGHGITGFEEIIGAEKEKSKIKKIEKVKKLYPEEVAYYIGDTKGDMLEGNRAECITIGVAWGWHSREKILEGKPSFIAERPEQIIELVEARNLQS